MNDMTLKEIRYYFNLVYEYIKDADSSETIINGLHL